MCINFSWVLAWAGFLALMLCVLSILPAECEGSAALPPYQWQVILTSHKKR